MSDKNSLEQAGERPVGTTAPEPKIGIHRQRLQVPVLPLAGSVVLPQSIHPLSLQGEQAARLVEAVQTGSGMVALFQQKGEPSSEPGLDDLHAVGTLASV